MPECFVRTHVCLLYLKRHQKHSCFVLLCCFYWRPRQCFYWDVKTKRCSVNCWSVCWIAAVFAVDCFISVKHLVSVVLWIHWGHIHTSRWIQLDKHVRQLLFCVTFVNNFWDKGPLGDTQTTDNAKGMMVMITWYEDEEDRNGMDDSNRIIVEIIDKIKANDKCTFVIFFLLPPAHTQHIAQWNCQKVKSLIKQSNKVKTRHVKFSNSKVLATTNNKVVDLLGAVAFTEKLEPWYSCPVQHKRLYLYKKHPQSCGTTYWQKKQKNNGHKNWHQCQDGEDFLLVGEGNNKRNHGHCITVISYFKSYEFLYVCGFTKWMISWWHSTWTWKIVYLQSCEFVFYVLTAVHTITSQSLEWCVHDLEDKVSWNLRDFVAH